MYSNKLVACVKVDGKVLREKGEEVLLPFGSEYSLYFKNENSRKVQIKVEIDGQDVMNGKALLLNAGDSMDLAGYVKDIHGDDNRAFKFITKTSEISDFRGDRAEDGLIKISYTFEKERPILKINDFINICGTNYPKSGGFVDNVDFGNLFGENGYHDNISHTTTNNISNNISYSTQNVSLRNSNLNSTTNISTTAVASNEPGITVEGSATGQSFQRGSIGVLEDKSYTMVFQLKGLTSEEVVTKPITVKTKKQCPSCGKKYKSSFQYCPKDGTYLR